MDGDKYSYILINTRTGSEISAVSKVTRLYINRLCILFGCWYRPLLSQAYDHTDRKIASCNALFHPSCTCCYDKARTVGGLIEQVRCPPLISHTCSIRSLSHDHAGQRSCWTFWRVCGIAYTACGQGLPYWNISPSQCRNGNRIGWTMF